MSGGAAWANWRGSTASSSPFFIDTSVYELAAPNMILQKLQKMQEDKTKGVFPVGSFRNYNVWGCGFQRLSGDWEHVHLWGPIPKEQIPAALDDVLASLELFWRDSTATGWCGDVGTLLVLLKHMKARC